MNFETALLLTIGALVLIAAGLLFSVWLDRRRRRSSSLFASLPVSPAPARRKLSAPTLVEFKTDPTRSERGNPRQLRAYRELAATMSDAEYARRSNYGMH